MTSVIRLIDRERAAHELTSVELVPQRVALLGGTRVEAAALFRRIAAEHPPATLRLANGLERAQWPTGSTLEVASSRPSWWGGRRFDALLLAAGELDVDLLRAIAPAFDA